MNLTSNYNLISRLADQRKPPSLGKVVKRVVILCSMALLCLLFSLTMALLIYKGNFVTDHTQLLASFCVVTGFVVFLFGIFSVFIFLLESFASAYLLYLDAKNDLLDARDNGLLDAAIA